MSRLDAIAHAEQAGCYSELRDFARAMQLRTRRKDDIFAREAARAERAAERVWGKAVRQ